MYQFRIPINFPIKNRPNLEALENFKGYYGIELVYKEGELQLFLLLQDKFLKKKGSKLNSKEKFIYFNSFGIIKDNLLHSESIELVNYDYINKNNNKMYLVFLDFSNASLVQFKEKLNYNFHEHKIRTNFIESILYLLLDFNNDFIWQIYFTSKKNSEFYIGSQFCIFLDNDFGNAHIKSIENNLGDLFSKYFITIKRPNIPLLQKNKIINSIKEHYPYKWYNKSIYMINHMFLLPDISNKLDKLIWGVNNEKDNNIWNNLNIKDGLPIGYEVIPGLKEPPIVKLSLEDLTSHFSCFGLTSQGKSRLMYNLLSIIDKTNKNFLIIDTKGEYLEALSKNSKKLNYFKIGSLEYPLQLNIFNVPIGVKREDHSFFLNSLLSGIMGDEISPQMNRILHKSIEYTVHTNGNFNDFLNIIENPKLLKIKGSYLELSSAGIVNRLLPLISGPGKNCFLTKHTNIDFFDFINENVIIDLSNFELIESTITRKIFVNTFLHYFLHAIRYKNVDLREKGRISNFILIEEIQKIAPILYQGRNQINSFIGLAPWTVRAYGVCMGFIGTDIEVETPILTNTGISMFFYSKTNIDKISKILGMQHKDYLDLQNKLKKRKRFILSIKGEIKILEAFEFNFPSGEDIKNKLIELSNARDLLNVNKTRTSDN